jgi:hypothetical protein
MAHPHSDLPQGQRRCEVRADHLTCGLEPDELRLAIGEVAAIDFLLPVFVRPSNNPRYHWRPRTDAHRAPGRNDIVLDRRSNVLEYGIERGSQQAERLRVERVRRERMSIRRGSRKTTGHGPEWAVIELDGVAAADLDRADE